MQAAVGAPSYIHQLRLFDPGDLKMVAVVSDTFLDQIVRGIPAPPLAPNTKYRRPCRTVAPALLRPRGRSQIRFIRIERFHAERLKPSKPLLAHQRACEGSQIRAVTM